MIKRYFWGYSLMVRQRSVESPGKPIGGSIPFVPTVTIMLQNLGTLWPKFWAKHLLWALFGTIRNIMNISFTVVESKMRGWRNGIRARLRCEYGIVGKLNKFGLCLGKYGN